MVYTFHLTAEKHSLFLILDLISCKKKYLKKNLQIEYTFLFQCSHFFLSQNVHVHIVDMSNARQVWEFAQSFSQSSCLHVLVGDGAEEDAVAMATSLASVVFLSFSHVGF